MLRDVDAIAREYDDAVHGLVATKHISGVERESDLTDPVTKKLIGEHSMKVKAEVPIGDRRADLVGYAERWNGRQGL